MAYTGAEQTAFLRVLRAAFHTVAVAVNMLLSNGYMTPVTCLPFSLLHDFRCHPAWGPNKGVAGHLLVAPSSATLHCGCYTKVSQQDSAILVY